MKKRDLLSLATLGMSAGLLMGACGDAKNMPKMYPDNVAPYGQNGQFSETDMRAFYNSLSPENQKKFDELDPQHKSNALRMANQQCKGKNECRGLGSCKRPPEHNCAGKNDCKGRGGAPVKDPNKAVEIQYDSQREMLGAAETASSTAKIIVQQ